MSRWLGLLLLLSIEGLIVTFLYFNREEKEHQVADRTLDTLQMAYNAALQTRDTAMRLAVQEVVLRHDVLAAFAEGVWAHDASEEAIARGKLYRMLSPTYQRLVSENILQFQFHTQDGRSYLRFRDPDRFGDDLKQRRPAIVKLIETEQPVKGFEVSTSEAGFCFVYPVFLGEQRLGSVEISASFNTLRASMSQLAPDHEYAFMVREDAIRPVLATQRSVYEPAKLNADYLVEDSKTMALNSTGASSAAFVQLQQQLKQSQKVQDAMREGRSVATSAWADGHWYNVSLLPVRDVKEKLVGYIASAEISPEIAAIQQDFWRSIVISALFVFLLGVLLWRAQSEAKLRGRQQLRLQTISNTMADGLYVTDHHGMINFVNPAAVDLLGYAADGLNGSLARLLFYVNAQGERGIEAKDCPLCKVLITGVPFRGEWRFMHQDGSVFDVEVASQPIMESDKVVGAVTVFRDVSARNAAQKEIIAARKLAEQASASKSAFLANMSHEIRTPMNGVLGMAALLQETPLNAEQQDYLQTIRSSGDALLTVIDDILDYSKIEAGMMSIESAPIDLRVLFKDVQRLLQVRANQKNLTLSLRLADAVPSIVLGDSVRIRQILLNLMGNAIKFTDQGGVEVSASLIKREGDRIALRIEVSDTGIGIASDKLDRLFKSFSQVDDSTSRRFGGTGLGLSISKRLAELMQGEMGVSSVEGLGSVFWFTLTVREATDVQSNTPSIVDVVSDLPPARILLVEDNLVNQKVAVAMLGKLGYKPVVANNGREAISLLVDQDFDLVFMDCQMPVMDGFEATRAIRAGVAGGHPNITVIALTANAMKEDQDACYASGMTDYLSKPLQMPALTAMLTKHLVAAPEPMSES